MAFYDELGKKIHKTGQGALEKTKSATETVRLNSAISDLEKEIAATFTELGKAYYNSNAQNPQNDLIQYFQMIENKSVQIKEYRDQICALKGMTKCTHCGKEIDINAVYCGFCGNRQIEETAVPQAGQHCSYCGQPLDEGVRFCTECGRRVEVLMPEKKERRFCVSCGKELVLDAMFCPYCGQNNEQDRLVENGEMCTNITDEIEEEPKRMPEIEPTEEKMPCTVDSMMQKSIENGVAQEEVSQNFIDKTEIEEPVIIEELNSESELGSDIAFCENCGYRLEPGDIFCPDCGHKIEILQKYHTFHDEGGTARPVCPVCGTEIERNALFCIECGYKLG